MSEALVAWLSPERVSPYWTLSAERLRGVARWAAGAAVWALFALVMLAAWIAPGFIAARLLGR